MSVFKLKVTKQSVDDLIKVLPQYKSIIHDAKSSSDKLRIKAAIRLEASVEAMQHFIDISPRLEIKKDCYIIPREYLGAYIPLKHYLVRKRLFKWL